MRSQLYGSVQFTHVLIAMLKWIKHGAGEVESEREIERESEDIME